MVTLVNLDIGLSHGDWKAHCTHHPLKGGGCRCALKPSVRGCAHGCAAKKNNDLPKKTGSGVRAHTLEKTFNVDKAAIILFLKEKFEGAHLCAYRSWLFLM